MLYWIAEALATRAGSPYKLRMTDLVYSSWKNISLRNRGRPVGLVLKVQSLNAIRLLDFKTRLSLMEVPFHDDTHVPGTPLRESTKNEIRVFLRDVPDHFSDDMTEIRTLHHPLVTLISLRNIYLTETLPSRNLRIGLLEGLIDQMARKLQINDWRSWSPPPYWP